MLGTVSELLASFARSVGFVAAVALLACARSVFGQGLAEVWTDKSVYLEGEAIEVTLRVTNPDSITYTWTTHCNAPTIKFDDIELDYEACILLVEDFHFGPGSWRTWTFPLRPNELGIPRTTGSHQVTARFAHLSASTEVQAPHYTGGRVRVFVPTGANEDSVQTVVDALGATVLFSFATDGGRDELWEIVGTTIDDAAATYQGPHAFLELSRYLTDFTTVATEPDDAGDRSFRAVAYPTHFSSSATILVDVGVSQHIRVEIFDVLGRRVSVLLDDLLAPGIHNVQLTADGLPSGRYVYRVAGRSSSETGFLIHTP